MLVLRSKAGEIMIRAIFKDKRMVGYATVGYYSSDPDEVVVELTEDRSNRLLGLKTGRIYTTPFFWKMRMRRSGKTSFLLSETARSFRLKWQILNSGCLMIFRKKNWHS